MMRFGKGRRLLFLECKFIWLDVIHRSFDRLDEFRVAIQPVVM